MEVPAQVDAVDVREPEVEEDHVVVDALDRLPGASVGNRGHVEAGRSVQLQRSSMRRVVLDQQDSSHASNVPLGP